MSEPGTQTLERTPQPARPAGLFARGKVVAAHFGPAFVASIAYIDPGNFATNFTAGARFGYQLLWVLLWSNAMAILIQYMAAKLGIATGRTLPENCRDHFRRPVVYLLWVAAEVGALATDLAEFLGAALGFYLLFGSYFVHLGWSKTEILLLAAAVAAVCVFALLALESWGFRKLEVAIIGFVCAIGICYALELGFIHPVWQLAAFHTLVPVVDRRSIYDAVSMLGATVMPHVIYLHSALVQPRVREQLAGSTAAGVRFNVLSRMKLLFYEKVDVLVAMNGAWLVNSAMLIVAATAFARQSWPDGLSIEDAHHTLGPLLGPASATIFAIALLCSGLSSATVGTMAGQIVLEGFLEVKFSIFLRRLITLVPAILVIATGLNPLKILILSQVVLSFALPFALIPLLILTNRVDVMGQFLNRSWTRRAGWLSAAVIIALNGMLLWQIFAGR
jgi:manganese transport protein